MLTWVFWLGGRILLWRLESVCEGLGCDDVGRALAPMRCVDSKGGAVSGVSCTNVWMGAAGPSHPGSPALGGECPGNRVRNEWGKSLIYQHPC